MVQQKIAEPDMNCEKPNNKHMQYTFYFCATKSTTVIGYIFDFLKLVTYKENPMKDSVL